MKPMTRDLLHVAEGVCLGIACVSFLPEYFPFTQLGGAIAATLALVIVFITQWNPP